MKQNLLFILEKAFNRFLFLDEKTKERLSKLQGKTVTIHLLPMDLVFQIHFTKERFHFRNGKILPADITITGTPFNMAALAMTLKNTNKKHFFVSDVSITGDVTLGQMIIQLFDELEIDIFSHLSNIIGEVPAFQLEKFQQKIAAMNSYATASLTRQIKEFFQEELQLVPPKEALSDFYKEIDHLRMRVDRLSSRLTKITKSWDKL